MRDTQYPLRKAIIDVLNADKPVIKGNPVTTYDEKLKAGASDEIFILTSTQQSVKADEQNDCAWITEEAIDLEIIHKTGFEVTKDFVDSVSDQVYAKLLPDRLNASIANPHLMLIQFFDLERALSRTVEVSASETIISKLLTFSCKIVQQS